MSSLGEMLPMEYIGPLVGGGVVPLVTCNPGSSTCGERCNTGNSTPSGDCAKRGNTTGGAICNTGSGTNGGRCASMGMAM